jgi:hypothetical protein
MDVSLGIVGGFVTAEVPPQEQAGHNNQHRSDENHKISAMFPTRGGRIFPGRGW